MLRRAARWFDDRTGLWSRLKTAAIHPVPRALGSMKHGWWYVFGAATLTAFAVQAVTGVTLATKYVPSPAHAYESLRFITEDAALGRLVRGMHYWGAGAMVLFVFVHMVRVFLTGSYKFPREAQWLTGVGLLVLTLALAYTGQLLRWDENGVWSVVVAANFVGRVPLIGDFLVDFLLAGPTVGGTTLSRFFAFHVFILPALLIALLAVHLYLVVRNGISEPPRAGEPVDPDTYRERHEAEIERHGVPYTPDASWREAAAGALVVLGIFLLALTLGPRELGGPPDPTFVQADPRPDWYFRWYYALITVVPGFWTDFLLVWMPLLALLALLVLPFVAGAGERHPLRRPWAVAVVGALFFGWAVLTWESYRAPWVPDFETQPFHASELEAMDELAQEGAVLFFERGCQYCHVVAGRGGAYGPRLTDAFSRFTREELTWIILTGRGNMPPYADSIEPRELEAILAFLEAIRP
jgi:ubiquinol-cytochrome c reductase cytochrome b subunit